MMDARSPSVRRSRGAWRRGQGGFTLVEALIMLALFAMIVLVALPNWMRARTKARANGGMRTVEAAFNFARTEALKRHSPVVLNVDVTNREFVTFEDWDPTNQDVASNGNGVRDGAELVISTRELDLALDFVSDPQGGSSLTSVAFASDGSNRGNTGGNAVFFSDIKNNVFRLNVNPVTGTARVEMWIEEDSPPIWSPRREAWQWNY